MTIREFNLWLRGRVREMKMTEECLNQLASAYAAKVYTRNLDLFDAQIEANAIVHGFIMGYRNGEKGLSNDLQYRALDFYLGNAQNTLNIFQETLVREGFSKGWLGGSDEYEKCAD